MILLLWLTVGWGLYPLKRMADAIRGRAPDNLAPLVFPPLPNELEPMAAALNRLLIQIENLLERERRFIADAAHELRTPLSAIIGFSEIIEQQLFGPVTEEYRILAGNILRDAERLLSGFDDLSTAAKIETGSYVAETGTTDRVVTSVRTETEAAVQRAATSAGRCGGEGRVASFITVENTPCASLRMKSAEQGATSTASAPRVRSMWPMQIGRASCRERVSSPV